MAACLFWAGGMEKSMDGSVEEDDGRRQPTEENRIRRNVKLSGELVGLRATAFSILALQFK